MFDGGAGFSAELTANAARMVGPASLSFACGIVFFAQLSARAPCSMPLERQGGSPLPVLPHRATVAGDGATRGSTAVALFRPPKVVTTPALRPIPRSRGGRSKGKGSATVSLHIREVEPPPRATCSRTPRRALRNRAPGGRRGDDRADSPALTDLDTASAARTVAQELKSNKPERRLAIEGATFSGALDKMPPCLLARQAAAPTSPGDAGGAKDRARASAAHRQTSLYVANVDGALADVVKNPLPILPSGAFAEKGDRACPICAAGGADRR